MKQKCKRIKKQEQLHINIITPLFLSRTLLKLITRDKLYNLDFLKQNCLQKKCPHKVFVLI